VLLIVACTPPPHPLPRRVIPDELVIRTGRFAFHMGARVDETWPARAEETRAALGSSLGVVVDQEDTLVPMLTQELGIEWPREQLDVEVALSPPGVVPACGDASSRRLTLDPHDGAEPTLLFACVLRKSLARLAPESAMYRAMPAVEGRDALYGCVVRYAVAAALVAGATDKSLKTALEQGLGESCDARELDWLGKEWLKRVLEEEGAASFGKRAGTELLVPAR
jgi:hypothetical protein